MGVGVLVAVSGGVGRLEHTDFFEGEWAKPEGGHRLEAFFLARPTRRCREMHLELLYPFIRSSRMGFATILRRSEIVLT